MENVIFSTPTKIQDNSFQDRRENNKIQIFNVSNYKVGENLLTNRLKSLNNKIEFNWLNESFNSYKVKCKKLFL